MQVKSVGVPWYRQEDYDQLKAIFSDGSKLHATFDGWLASAQSLHDRLVAEGHVVENDGKTWKITLRDGLIISDQRKTPPPPPLPASPAATQAV